jgi:hypothetical protein
MIFDGSALSCLAAMKINVAATSGVETAMIYNEAPMSDSVAVMSRDAAAMIFGVSMMSCLVGTMNCAAAMNFDGVTVSFCVVLMSLGVVAKSGEISTMSGDVF